MLTCEGFTETNRASRYLVQLCKHMSARGMTVETSEDTYGFTDFGWGICTLRARDEGLVMTIESGDPRVLDRVQCALTRDIERFGRRDGLTVTWTMTSS